MKKFMIFIMSVLFLVGCSSPGPDASTLDVPIIGNSNEFVSVDFGDFNETKKSMEDEISNGIDVSEGQLNSNLDFYGIQNEMGHRYLAFRNDEGHVGFFLDSLYAEEVVAILEYYQVNYDNELLQFVEGYGSSRANYSVFPFQDDYYYYALIRENNNPDLLGLLIAEDGPLYEEMIATYN